MSEKEVNCIMENYNLEENSELLESRRNGDQYFYNFHITNLDILFCGTQKCYPRHNSGPFVRSYFLIVFVHSGKGKFRTQNRLYSLGKGSTFFLFPGEITYYEADKEEPWEYTWIAFSCTGGVDDVEQLLLRSSVSAQSPVHIAQKDNELQTLYTELIYYCRSETRHTDIKIMSLFWDIIYQYTITANQVYKINRVTPMSDHISIAIEYIKCYYSNSISVQMIADHVGISREHLCALFKKQYGVSPVRFIRGYRLQNASVLLITTEYSIEKISELAGFSDYNYFSNQFHKAFECSPTVYRKRGHESGSFPLFNEKFKFNSHPRNVSE